MIRKIRKFGVQYIFTVPIAYCELLDIKKGDTLYVSVRGEDLILDPIMREKSIKEGIYDLIYARKLLQMGNSNSLVLAIPMDIVKVLNYKQDLEVNVELLGKRILIRKLQPDMNSKKKKIREEVKTCD